MNFLMYKEINMHISHYTRSATERQIYKQTESERGGTGNGADRLADRQNQREEVEVRGKGQEESKRGGRGSGQTN